MKGPKVSVSLITFNQENYISACLDSILKQVTDFDFEIVVADDCSTDGTQGIVADYALRYPALIRPILREKNLGLVKNAIATIKACSGEYIALMEGDDFWVDEHKLQIQVDFLNKNADCVICFTNQYHFFEEDFDKKYTFYSQESKPPKKFDLDFFIKNKIIIPNNTKMFRKEVQPEFLPDWFFNSLNWDWVLHILQASNAKLGYIDKITLAYRRHADALFMSKNEVNILLNGIETAREVNKYLNYRYDSRFKNLSWEYYELAFAYLEQRDLLNFLFYYGKYFFDFDKFQAIRIKDDLWRIKTVLMRRK
jgi:glycosyltransferase involved in cell wall biosynthesis